MIRNYLKLALRNISRRKLYTVINIIGLGVASAFCILVYWYAQHERSFDRTKEIGIRKVLGASVSDLFLLLNKSTFTTALFSFAVAVPVAVYLTNAWLQNFAYRISLSWTLFALAGLLSLLTALIAVSYHTMKTARANPVKSLRTE